MGWLARWPASYREAGPGLRVETRGRPGNVASRKARALGLLFCTPFGTLGFKPGPDQSLDTVSRLRNKTGLFRPLPQVANALSQSELSSATERVRIWYFLPTRLPSLKHQARDTCPPLSTRNQPVAEHHLCLASRPAVLFKLTYFPLCNPYII
jgi:hypothetical protein